MVYILHSNQKKFYRIIVKNLYFFAIYHREGTDLSEESLEARKLWKAVLYRLVRIEETLGSGVENQKRLLGLFTPQRVRAKRSPLGSWIQKKLGL